MPLRSTPARCASRSNKSVPFGASYIGQACRAAGIVCEYIPESFDAWQGEFLAAFALHRMKKRGRGVLCGQRLPPTHRFGMRFRPRIYTTPRAGLSTSLQIAPHFLIRSAANHRSCADRNPRMRFAPANERPISAQQLQGRRSVQKVSQATQDSTKGRPASSASNERAIAAPIAGGRFRAFARATGPGSCFAQLQGAKQKLATTHGPYHFPELPFSAFARSREQHARRCGAKRFEKPEHRLRVREYRIQRADRDERPYRAAFGVAGV